MFEHFSRAHGTPVAILRLNYATELRYGVLVDLARRVRRGEPIDVTMGYFNVIWQGDANAMALPRWRTRRHRRSIVNVAGPEELSVRAACHGARAPARRSRCRSRGRRRDDALLSNAAQAGRCLGRPRVDADRLIAWIADWTRRGGETSTSRRTSNRGRPLLSATWVPIEDGATCLTTRLASRRQSSARPASSPRIRSRSTATAGSTSAGSAR